ncbi:MAG TPA: hypothetical protein VFZ21_10005 [Gemmatimonadaceae bacterium]|jgi:hypothetical protein|nr:hypothetical protein [Gemmatimonadaceae bacterium]
MMQGTTRLKALAVASVGAFLVACGDKLTSPAPHEAHTTNAEIVSTTIDPEPIDRRATLDPFFLNQMPELMFRSNIPLELIVQRLVVAPTPGGWHTHTGPSFSIVDAGTVILHRYSKKHGCVSTTYTKGDTYVEEAGEIHRAEVPEPATAVEYKVRFYTQPGAPLSESVDNPCGNGERRPV